MHAVDEQHAAIAHGGQPRINNLRQGPILVRDLATHVACLLQKCRNAGSRNEHHAPLGSIVMRTYYEGAYFTSG